jgi:hypothetical protein
MPGGSRATAGSPLVMGWQLAAGEVGVAAEVDIA